jgi:uncharacterized protein (TIGR03000 family)
MAALATSSSTPGWGHHAYYGNGYGGCYGCLGCYGVGYGNYGGYGGYGGCYACYGCFGGYGCYAGGYGHGCYAYYTGWGCYGYWGGSPYAICYGTSAFGGYGGYGYGSYGIPYPGGITYTGPGMTNPVPPNPILPGPVVAPPPDGTPTPKPGKGPPPEGSPDPKPDKDQQTRAKVRIDIPADAQLYVDGVLMKTGSAVRMFRTPELAPNQSYYYELKAVLVRDGQTVTDSQQITVRPGALVTASFAGLEQKAAAAVQAAQSTAQR